MRTLFSKDERRALAEKAADESGIEDASRWLFVRFYLTAHYLVDVVMTKRYGLPEDFE